MKGDGLNEDIIYQKIGVTIRKIALELLGLKEGDRIPNIMTLEEKLHVSRGTIQNALGFLKEKNAIEIINKGNLGSYLKMIDVITLRSFCMHDYFFGVMSLPYSKVYEGLATALYDALKSENFRFALSYTRGASNRMRLVENGAFDFAVVSLFSAHREIQEHSELKIVMDFKEGSYINSKHAIVTRKGIEPVIRDGMKVGIDMDSIDQRELTFSLSQSHDIQFVEIASQNILQAIRDHEIDLVVWNYDEIIEKGYADFEYAFINNEMSKELSTAVIVIQKENLVAETIIADSLDINKILQIQEIVKNGEKVPIY